MGRDQTRVLVCAVLSLALLIAGTLIMEWFRLDATTGDIRRLTIDLRSVHVCNAAHVCNVAPKSVLPVMYPTLANSTLWSCLTVGLLVAIQAGMRLLTTGASDRLTKFGYVLTLSTLATVAATAYLFGPVTEDLELIGELTASLHRTWAPVVTIVGLIGSLATLYMVVAPAAIDLGSGYRPVQLAPPSNPGSQRVVDDAPQPLPPGEPVVAGPPLRAPTVPLHGAGAPAPGAFASVATDPTGSPWAGATEPLGRPLAPLLAGPIKSPPPGTLTVPPGLRRSPTAPITPMPGIAPMTALRRPPTAPMAPIEATPPGPGSASRASQAAMPRPKSASIPPVPDHLRNRMSYVALTVELTGGGIDARREDSSARLVLWRDVVGVVVRRMPPAYDGTTFIDVVSTAGSTLRIVPWTRLTGDPIAGDGPTRLRAIVERVVARCPHASIDSATRQFLDTGEVAQIPDLESLHAHDGHLA